MQLYRLSVIVGDHTVDRAVWADRMEIQEGAIVFKNYEGDILSMYPVKFTFITNVESKEQYERRKAGEV